MYDFSIAFSEKNALQINVWVRIIKDVRLYLFTGRIEKMYMSGVFSIIKHHEEREESITLNMVFVRVISFVFRRLFHRKYTSSDLQSVQKFLCF